MRLTSMEMHDMGLTNMGMHDSPEQGSHLGDLYLSRGEDGDHHDAPRDERSAQVQLRLRCGGMDI